MQETKTVKPSDRLRETRKSRKMTQREVAEAVGITPAALSFMEAGQRGISPENAQKLAAVIKTTPEYLLYGTEHPPSALPMQEGQIPVLGTTQAGNWREMIVDTNAPKITVDAKYAVGKNFALVVEGDSMEPTIPQGVYVVIDPTDTDGTHNKVYCVAHEDGSSTIKRLKIDGKYKSLYPDNTRIYQPQEMPKNSRIIGRVIAFHGEL